MGWETQVASAAVPSWENTVATTTAGSSSWENTGTSPAATGGGTADWNTKAMNGASGGDWVPEGGATAFSNVSKHEDGVFDNGVGGGNTCHNCGQSGHFSRECPEPRKASGACFNCGQEGHTKTDCPNPRVFKGTCRICSQEGHPASECPDKPADICKNCKQEGHKTIDCKNNRTLDLSDVPDKSPEEAFEMLKKADQERDLDDFREAVKIYSKAVPLTTYQQLEQTFREHKFNVHLIAIEKSIPSTHVIVDLQGRMECKYQVSYHRSAKPRIPQSAARFPSTPEENIERLAEAGMVVDRKVTKCANCNELGHSAKFCPEDKATIERAVVKCVICEELGHRARDCKQPRVDRWACRNCKKSGHNATECPEPRSAEGVECKRCNETGHFAKDCPSKTQGQGCRNCGEEAHQAKECDKPKNPANAKCRNCEEIGHFTKECPLPKDWSKVQCRNCGEMGHGAGRCTQPKTEDGGFGGGPGANDNAGFRPTDNVGGTAGFDNAGFETSTATNGGGDWNNPTGDTSAGASTGASAGGWATAAPPADDGWVITAPVNTAKW